MRSLSQCGAAHIWKIQSIAFPEFLRKLGEMEQLRQL